MGSNPLRQQVASMRQSLFDEEILDKQFMQMEQLEDVDNPNFAEEVMTLYIRDSTKLIATVEQALERTPYDVNKLDKSLHQLKGSSASVGANKVWSETNQMRESIKAGDLERTKAQLQLIKLAHETLRGKVEPYFHLVRQVGPSETAQRPK
ncbi:unnamed protein product [Prunus armeniaca]|uniref:Histidine-containing phosphotransfer protein n=1 Tax=Prunus armeniaca TaxID=36596 RepID=A0A6J5VR25_PRUAR|nr:unnamed protein product [Prunus armeniaca]